jgi:hypothetical protein
VDFELGVYVSDQDRFAVAEDPPGIWPDNIEAAPWTSTDAIDSRLHDYLETHEALARLHLSIQRYKLAYHSGGLLFGFGVRSDFEDHARSFRIGYEFAVPIRWVHSVNVETDFADAYTLVPMTEFTFPSDPPFFLDVGLGGGVPVKLAPEANVGFRAYASLHYLALGVFASLDYSPPWAGKDAGRGVLEGSLGLLVSL